MSYWRSCALAVVLMGVASISARAQNSIQSINSSSQAGSEVVRIELAEPLSAVPAGFTIRTPPRIAIDLPGSAMRWESPALKSIKETCGR